MLYSVSFNGVTVENADIGRTIPQMRSQKVYFAEIVAADSLSECQCLDITWSILASLPS